ncbi:MAG: Cof-type HAD-IIB family hydrolase [Pseudomonadota bacterium]|nr:Cof-type HAD-IIB family hydrolase [Pseudomonadota bacterium]
MSHSIRNQVQLVVADMDGTLLNGEHKLTPNTVATVQSLVAQGVQFMLATGRHYEDVYLMAQQLGVEACLITSNGARVHDYHGQVLYENHMPESLVKQVLQISRGFELHRNVYQQDLWLVEEPHEALLAIHDQSGFRYQMADFSNMDLSHIDKIYFTAEHEKLVPLERLLASQFSDMLSVTFTSPEYLEVMNFGVSKGQALKKVLQLKGKTAQQTLAFGDGMNDISMLQLAGFGVVMENASEAVKQQLPNCMRAASNSNEGVALFIQQHLLD